MPRLWLYLQTYIATGSLELAHQTPMKISTVHAGMDANTATQRLLYAYALSSGRSQGQRKQYAIPPTYAVPALTKYTLRKKGLMVTMSQKKQQ